ncbi:immunoglobulin-like and fibronectin type III domain-containing protein 1 [Cololabis saira]|uniref:immunoglobulin-like and fibronectin type III domain-containing protein 1 n=1 Tax=Cololabis saira TaxID=129043 RepID=UPI002AD469DA|nr:immunoglobulin-like and fibronectin type III domain-containing protein 1 [Cololabis saira]
MWKSVNGPSKSTPRPRFSIVHQYIQRFNEVSGTKTGATRRRSKTPGVMITQYEPDLPEGKSTPDFQCKPIPATVQEGKTAVFRALVTGDPKPDVSWRRTKGLIPDNDTFQRKYDDSTKEHILEIHKVTAEEADTYKCYAANEYGKAVCATVLNVMDANPADFRKMLRKSKVQPADGENDERFWDKMLNADRSDYEHICSEFGVTDLHLILKKLEEKKMERKRKKNKQDGISSSDDDATEKHGIKGVARVKDIKHDPSLHNDKEQYQRDDGKVNLRNRHLNQADDEEDRLIAEFKLSHVDFVIKIQEIQVQEKEDALFECVLTHPLPRITWMKKGVVVEQGGRCSIIVSEDKLIHSLLIKDCNKTDKSIYSAVAGITSCSAWLVVEDESDPEFASKKTVRKVPSPGGAQTDREKVGKEQQIKHQKEMGRISGGVKAEHTAGQMKKGVTIEEWKATVEKAKTLMEGGTGWKSEDPGCVTDAGHPTGAAVPERKKDTKESSSGCVDVDVDVDRDQMLNPSEMAESRGTTNSTMSVINQAKAKKVHWKQNTSGDGSDNEASDADEDADSAGHNKDQRSSKRSSKQGKKTTGNGRIMDPNEDGSDNEASDSDEDADSAGHNKDQRSSKQSSKRGKKTRVNGRIMDPNEDGSDSEASDSDEDADSAGLSKDQKSSKRGKKTTDAVNGKNSSPEDQGQCEETEDVSEHSTHTKRKRQGPLVEDSVLDPGVQFIWGLSDVHAIINEEAELTCKLSSEDCEGVWLRDGKKISPDDNVSITKDGPVHKLLIIKCSEEHSGKYRFEADGRKTEAMINVKDPPRFDGEDLRTFTEPLTVKAGHNAVFKLQFVGHKPIKIQWFKEGEELQDDNNTKIEKSACHSRLLLSRCQRKDTGEIKLKLKNEHGFTEAFSQLVVLDKPTSPLGPVEVIESSANCIEFSWRPPKDDGGSPVIKYLLERQQVGRNTWKKIGEMPTVPRYRDTNVDRGRRYWYHIRAVTLEGTSELMETDDMQAGMFAFPGPPAPPQVVSAFNDCINLSWAAPSNTGGSRLLGYILEKHKKGSNLWTVVNAVDELIKEKKYAVKDVFEGLEYEFRVSAINLSGVGECSNPSAFVHARDPKKPPGKVTNLKVTETFYTSMGLAWTKPEEKPGIQDEAKGYFVEIRRADCIEWSRCNITPVITASFNVKGLKSMDMYWVRVIATNDGGESAPEELPNYIRAMPSPIRPKFTNNKMKSFMVVRAGNSVRMRVNFEASPWPDILWLKDNMPVTKRATISNSDGSSQLLIPSSERSDSGIYSISVKNLVGQETYSTEIWVTDDPKPPGPVELEENVPGTVTVIWEPSTDEKRDDRLHYMVSKLDSTNRTWTTVADRLFNNRFTVCNIIQGREYHFRVYAKNDMGISNPSESPTWGMKKKKDRIVVSEPSSKNCDLRCPPSFIVPLKFHTASKGYECYMSCAVKGNPTPHITWYRNQISLNTDTNYYISNICGVCSLLILHVGPKDVGEYTITAVNSLGQAECSTMLSVRD